MPVGCSGHFAVCICTREKIFKQKYMQVNVGGKWSQVVSMRPDISGFSEIMGFVTLFLKDFLVLLDLRQSSGLILLTCLTWFVTFFSTNIPCAMWFHKENQENLVCKLTLQILLKNRGPQPMALVPGRLETSRVVAMELPPHIWVCLLPDESISGWLLPAGYFNFRFVATPAAMEDSRRLPAKCQASW